MKNITDPLLESLASCFSAKYKGITSKKISLAIEQFFSKNSTVKEQHLLTIKEVAERLSVTPRTIHNLIKRGELEKVKVRRATRITPSSLDAYISMNTSRGGDHVE